MFKLNESIYKKRKYNKNILSTEPLIPAPVALILDIENTVC